MRKNKKLMLGAIAAMGVMAMGVGGVGTFAWYSATANSSVTTTAVDQSHITATDDEYTIGGAITINVRFAAVAEGNPALPTYVPAVEDDPATQDVDESADAYFGDVDVTDANGEAQAITTGGLVPVTPHNPYGVAKVEVYLTENDATYTLAQLIGLLPDDTKYTVSLTTPNPAEGENNHARVYKAAPSTGTNGYASQTVECKVAFNRAAGTWALEAVSGSTISQPATQDASGSLKFYYSAENALSGNVAETSAKHVNDNIKVSIA